MHQDRQWNDGTIGNVYESLATIYLFGPNGIDWQGIRGILRGLLEFAFQRPELNSSFANKNKLWAQQAIKWVAPVGEVGESIALVDAHPRGSGVGESIALVGPLPSAAGDIFMSEPCGDPYKPLPLAIRKQAAIAARDKPAPIIGEPRVMSWRTRAQAMMGSSMAKIRGANVGTALTKVSPALVAEWMCVRCIPPAAS